MKKYLLPIILFLLVSLLPRGASAQQNYYFCLWDSTDGYCNTQASNCDPGQVPGTECVGQSQSQCGGTTAYSCVDNPQNTHSCSWNGSSCQAVTTITNCSSGNAPGSGCSGLSQEACGVTRVSCAPSNTTSCDQLGEACCSGNYCANGFICNGSICTGKCGDLNEACCPNPEPGTSGCFGATTCENGKCVGLTEGCGDYRQLCCQNNTCNQGLNCVDNTCSQSCGTVGNRCCDKGTSCSSGRCNDSGFCEQPVSPTTESCQFSGVTVSRASNGVGFWVTARVNFTALNHDKTYALNMNLWNDPLNLRSSLQFNGADFDGGFWDGAFEVSDTFAFDNVSGRNATLFICEVVDSDICAGQVCKVGVNFDQNLKVGDKPIDGFYLGLDALTAPCGIDDDRLATAIGCIPIDFIEISARFSAFAIGLGGGIALILIVFASYRIMTSAGDPKAVAAGKELLTSALMGLLLAILSGFILRIIGVDVLTLF